MKKILKKILLGILAVLALFTAYFFVGKTEPAQKIIWGANFSQKQAEALGMDLRKTYLALLDDLGVRNLKLATYWNLIEKEETKYNFDDLDWQINEAEKRNVKLLLVVGMKTPRWPECHIPEWAEGLSKEDQRSRILGFLEAVVQRYRGRASVWAWQVENEPFFPFGECPEGVLDKNFLKKEAELVRSLDAQRPVTISDSGEFSLWIRAAKLGDVVGITMYKKVWFSKIKKHITYFFPAIFYHRKAEIIKRIFNREVIGVELQTEPWCPTYLLSDCPAEEQQKTMNLKQFQDNIEFAKNTGLSRHYLWGAEWWYWMKEKQNQPAIWEESQKLF